MTNQDDTTLRATRRVVLLMGAAAGAMLAMPSVSLSQTSTTGDLIMTTFTTADGTKIFYKD